MIEIQLQHGGNSYPRSGSWKRTSQNGTRENKGSKRMENTNKDQGRQKFPRIHQFLLTVYSQLQPYCKAIKQIEGQKGMERGKGTSRSI